MHFRSNTFYYQDYAKKKKVKIIIVIIISHYDPASLMLSKHSYEVLDTDGML